MPRYFVKIAVHNSSEFRELSRELRRLGRGDLQKKFRDGIREAGKPVVEHVRQAVLSLNVKGTPGGGSAVRQAFAVSRARTDAGRHRASRRNHGLRNTVARNTNLSMIANGVRIICRGASMPPGQRELPKHLDSRGGWMHPFFGNRERWYHETGGPWFESTIRHDAREFHDQIVKKMEDVKRELEK